jgi:transcriptional regulator with XRE-family HTH domain
MKNIHVGNIIAAKRKEKGITQEDLAAYLGVSKPAVSKWESDNSYPDITLLPVIAAYFNISIDELIGYEPQMNEEDIKKLYQKLTDSFATRPFEEVYKECKEYIKKYYSCWRFLYYMALLFVNHSNLAGPMEKVLDMIKEAAELFERVVSSSNEPSLAKQAEQLQAYCYLCMGQQAKSIELLENTIEQCTP